MKCRICDFQDFRTAQWPPVLWTWFSPVTSIDAASSSQRELGMAISGAFNVGSEGHCGLAAVHRLNYFRKH